MAERTSRTRVGDHPRAAEGREWEVFVRERASAPLQSVGSVTAPTADGAHELASQLFAWQATDLWLCPADEVVRYAAHDLDDASRAGAEPAADSEP